MNRIVVALLKELPKNCLECPCSHRDTGMDVCHLDCGINHYKDGKLDGCPVKEIDDPKALKKKLEELRELIWMEDIPSPTTPEYIEHHKSIQKILKFINEELLTY
jgi:hypothetical protein